MMNKIDRAKIANAIILIHNDEKYFKGMNILCKLIGWPNLRNQFDSSSERKQTTIKFNNWIKKLKGQL